MTQLQEIIREIKETGSAEVLVTPEFAKELLGNMPHQRTLSNSRRDRYWGMMKRGEWLVGPPLALDEDGNVIEGQHRLRAVIKYGKPVRFIIIVGLKPDAIYAFDTGSGKSLADMLKLRGEKGDVRTLASAIGWLHRYRGGITKAGSRTQAPSVPQGFALLDQNPGLRESVHTGQRIARAIKFPRALGTFLHYAFSEKDADEAEVFFEWLRTDDELPMNNPIHVLREKVIKNSQQPEEKRMGQVTMAAISIKAWNSWLRGDARNQLNFRVGGRRPEDFPEVLGPDDV